jgi:hypothetical protein
MNNLREANREALESVNTIISGQSIDLNTQQKRYLKDLLSRIEVNTQIFDLQNQRWGPVVEARTTVTFDARPHPKVVLVKLDVDIPSSDSTQQPHIGCEVYWNKKRVGNDHIWIAPNILHAGRSAIQHVLEDYGYYPPWLEAEVHNQNI